jgi:hypothetical protein
MFVSPHQIREISDVLDDEKIVLDENSANLRWSAMATSIKNKQVKKEFHFK